MESAKILIVEDEVIVARTIANQLNQLGYTVIGTASSGKVAIAKALETKPELVLMDIILKGDMDGIATASYIRENLDIPVIFLTAYGDDNTLERAKITQPFGYIVKPFTSKDLRIAIEIGLLKHSLEQDIRENRDKLATLLNSISDAVIATNEQGIITFMNPASEELTGWSQTDAIGEDISKILHLVDDVTNTKLENPVTTVLREQQVVYLQEFTSLINKDGKRIPIGDSASPIMGLPNRINGVVIVFWDLSERRKTEILEKALQKEQEVNHLKSLFISTVSHEFRNPLSVIQTAVELIELQGEKLTETKKNTYVRRIKLAVQSMKNLMENVLLMGKAEANKLECQLELIDLNNFCQELVQEFTDLTTSGHEVIFTCTSQQNAAYVDEQLLNYMLVNLLSNAVKYSPQTDHIHFDLICDQTQNLATFTIQDEGIGIPATEQARLFESFYRASNTQTIQGTGLGLVIVKRCVEAHKGTITFSSQEGHGTTFTIKLPLKPRE